MKKEATDEVAQKELLGKESYPREVYHTAVWGLIAITIIGIVGIVVLAAFASSGPHEGLIAISSAAVGGLVSIFSQKAR